MYIYLLNICTKYDTYIYISYITYTHIYIYNIYIYTYIYIYIYITYIDTLTFITSYLLCTGN